MDHEAHVRKLEASLLKLYVVNTVQNNRTDKLGEFFDKMAPQLQHQPDWKDFFSGSFFFSFLFTYFSFLFTY